MLKNYLGKTRIYLLSILRPFILYLKFYKMNNYLMRLFPNIVMYFVVLLSKFHDEIVKGLTSLESHQLKAAVDISF